MIKPITILLLLLFGCTTADRYDLFRIGAFNKFEFLDLENVNDIITFNKKFWRADSVDDDFIFIAKFNFEKGDFSNKSDKGIKIEGLPYHCLEYDCHRNYGQRLYLSDNYEVLNDDMELVNENQIKELIKINILNYGKDPSLSDEPSEAVTELYLKPEHKIDKLGHIFKIITDGYIDIIEAKRLETKWTTEKLIDEFPFRLHLRQNMIPKDLLRIIEIPTYKEIEEEIILDSIALNLK